MGSSKRYAATRSRKRKGFNKKPSQVPITPPSTPSTPATPTVVGASSRKFSTPDIDVSENPPDVDEADESETCAFDCNFFMNSDLFMSLILMIGKCPDCSSPIEIKHDISKKCGVVQFFKMTCNACEWSLDFSSSKECSEDRAGRKAYELNRRLVIAFRENGQGFKNIIA